MQGFLSNFFLSFMLFLFLLSVSIFFIPLDLMWLDAGELASSAWSLGIAHPPGFSAHMALHHFIMKLIPFGSIAFRSNLSSAMIGLASLFMLNQIYQNEQNLKLGQNLNSDQNPRKYTKYLMFAIILAHPITHLHFFAHEVYSGLLFYLLLLYLVYQTDRQNLDLRYMLLGFFLIGFGFGIHPEIRIYLILFFILYLISFAFSLHQKKKYIYVILFLFLLFASVVILYLPIRSSTQPMRNWGNPSQFDLFIQHFFGQRILNAYQQEMFVFDLDHLNTLLDQLFNPPFLIYFYLSILSFHLFHFRKNQSLLLLHLMLIIDFIYSLLINPMGIRDQQNGLISVVLLALIFSLSIDQIIASLNSFIQKKSQKSPLISMTQSSILLSALGIFIIGIYDLSSYRNEKAMGKILNAISDQSKSASLVLLKSDHLLAGTAFLQSTESWRLDLGVLARQHLWDQSAIQPVAQRLTDLFIDPLNPTNPINLEKWFQSKPPKVQIDWEWGQGGDHDWIRFDRTTLLLQDLDLLKSISSSAHSTTALKAMAYFFADIADFAISQDRFLDALNALSLAIKLNPQSSTYSMNLGQILLRLGDLQHAIQVTEIAKSLKPNDLKIRVNLSRLYLNDQKIDLAKNSLNDLAIETQTLLDCQKLSKENQLNWSNLFGIWGVISSNEGKLKLGQDYFKKALILNPKQIESLTYYQANLPN
jgi:tetratricopeptide (TPR) repeat protein